MTKGRVLWIEDGAHYELAHLAGPVYLDGRFVLTVAKDASEASEMLRHNEYDALVLDIRLPPGESKEWIDIYKAQSGSSASVRLGLIILESLLTTDEPSVNLQQARSWITPGRIGVLTVEGYDEIGDIIKASGIRAWRQKHADMPESILLEIIEELFAH
jgi:CheY-like chemotaxis protein